MKHPRFSKPDHAIHMPGERLTRSFLYMCVPNIFPSKDEVFLKKVLSFFRSMRFGMILLILIMLLSLAGSLVPQNEPAMTYVRAFGAKAAALLMLFGVDDIFHAPLFYVLEILLCLNLLFCSLTRFSRLSGAGRRLLAAASKAKTEQPLDADGREKLPDFLRACGFRETASDNDSLLFHRCFSGFYGSFLVHLSILVILLFGFLTLTTPKIVDLTLMPGADLTLEDGTRIHLDNFHITDAEGKLDYASVLTAVSADGSSEKTQEIRVNEPLRFGALKIFQQTYGTAGQVRIDNLTNGTSDTVSLTEPCFLSIDGQNGVWFHALYPGFTRDGDGNYTLITNTTGSYQDPVYRIESITDGMSTSVLAFPGEEITIRDIRYTFLSPIEYPGLRVKRVSPALYAGLYLGFALMLVALWLCFFRVPVCIAVRNDGYTIVSPREQQLLRADIQVLLQSKES